MKIKIPGGTSFELSIIPLDEVRPHEATIPNMLDALVKDLRRTREQRDPILVDKKTHTALDGMHRRAALETLGAKFAVCAEYNYLGVEVKLERWLRYFLAPSREFLSELTALLDLRQSQNFRAAASQVDSKKSKIALLSAANSFVSKRKWEIGAVYDALGEIDKLCQKYKIELEFAPETAKFELFTSESVYVLYPERLAKKDVIEMVRENRVFPCKTTRHIVPVRPMGVFFPLDYLQKSTISECVEALENIVDLSTLEIEKRDVWYEGRRYSEPLAIFRRKKDNRSATVRIHGSLGKLPDGRKIESETVSVPIKVGDILLNFSKSLGIEIKRDSTLVLVNGVEANALMDLDTVVVGGDEVSLIPMFHGG